MSVLLPRLDREAVRDVLPGIKDRYERDGSADKGSSHVLPARTTYAQSGGAPATSDQLKGIRTALCAIARECGWMKEGARPDTARFDALAASWLATCPLLDSGDAHRDDSWACLATCVVPELVLWRFGMKQERFLGGIRNTFQRLWIRGRLLDRGVEFKAARWQLLEELSEDALVAISERPSIAGDRRLALAIAEGWVRSVNRGGKRGIEDRMREAIRAIRIKNELVLISALDDTAVAEMIDNAFKNSESRAVDYSL